MIDYYYCYLHNKDEGTWRSDSQWQGCLRSHGEIHRFAGLAKSVITLPAVLPENG